MDDHINSDYQTDFYIWLNNQIALLRAKNFERIDLDNLIEELEGMASKQRHELKHRLEQLTMRLLKCKLQPRRISKSWRRTIHEQRRHINDLLEEMPSLERLLDEFMERSYANAVRGAAIETGLSHAEFPSTPPFTKAQLLDPDYIP
jgi:type I site-specific restriction endonuclease